LSGKAKVKGKHKEKKREREEAPVFSDSALNVKRKQQTAIRSDPKLFFSFPLLSLSIALPA
jgi:hypothetical protein